MDGSIAAGRWVGVGTIGEIPRLGARRVAFPEGDAAIFRTADDEILALENRCPHKGGPLSEGIVHGRSVSCPLHNWTIDLTSGEAAAPDRGCARSIPVRIIDGRIEILRRGE